LNRPTLHALPVRRGERERLLLDAVLDVPLFGEVVAEFLGHGRLPDDLDVLLERKFGVLRQSAGEVAVILRTSLAQAGLIDAGGRFLAEASNGVPAAEQVHPSSHGLEAPRAAPSSPTESGTISTTTLELPSERVRVILQASLSEGSVHRIERWLTTIVVPSLEFFRENPGQGGD
jgi:hypothetical protein